MSRLAAIDVGTNTVRLLVASVDESRVTPVERDLEITRLGQGVDASRELDPRAVERTVEVVERFAGQARALGCNRVRIGATSAVRDARNEDDFLRAVEKATGVEPEVLDGVDEGRLSFLGATLGREGGPFVVVDIGGGSTELVRGTGGAEAIWSADVGSVRLRERCLSSDPPTSGEVEGARSLVGAALVEAERHLGVLRDETLIGVAGTVTTLAALVLGLDSYDPDIVDGSFMSLGDVAAWTDRLLAMTVSEVRGLPSMHPGRADVIASGALILRELMDRWSFGQVVVSESDILTGLIADMAGLGATSEVVPRLDGGPGGGTGHTRGT